MMQLHERKIGALTILILGGTFTAMSALMVWTADIAVDNKVMVKPLTSAIDRLTVSMDKAETRNSLEHDMIVKTLGTINGRININETKLFRVITDCKDNHIEIQECRDTHSNNFYLPPYKGTE